MPPRPKALLISAYDARSHARWREGLVRHCDAFDWQTLTLPPRHFAWRVRGNALALAAHTRAAARDGPLALLVATSMTDVLALRALRPALAAVPLVLVFHENQFAYPRRGDAAAADALEDVRFASVLRALAADVCVFNSRWNRDSFLDGARALLERMPDAVPDSVAVELEARCEVLPVPLEDTCYRVDAGARARPARPLTLVWNHRWEHDKAPERLLAALRLVRAAGVPFRLHVLGERFRTVPDAFAGLRAEFDAALGRWGYEPDTDAYRALLADSDVVLSTALHDFQGLAVLDGVAAGCDALVPDRLAYREYLPSRCRYASWPDRPDREARALAEAIVALDAERRSPSRPAPPDVSAFAWSTLAPAWRTLLDAVARRTA